MLSSGVKNVGSLCFTNGEAELKVGHLQRGNPDMERIFCNLHLIQPADKLPTLMHQSRDAQKGAG